MRALLTFIFLSFLVYASAQSCVDSSFRKSLTFTNQSTSIAKTINTSDGNFLMAGEITSSNLSNFGAQYNGLLIKADSKGNILWMKQFADGNNNKRYQIDINSLFELQNKDIIATGTLDTGSIGNMPPTAIIFKLDANGNTLWYKVILSALLPTGNQYPVYFNCLAEGNNDDIILGGYTSTNSFGSYETLLRMDVNGNIAWDDNNCGISSYGDFYNAQANGVYMQNGNIIETGFAEGSYYIEGAISFLTLDYNTGALLKKRFFSPNYGSYDNNYYVGLTTTNNSVRLNNGHYVIYGNLISDFAQYTDTTNHFGVIEFDTAQNLFNAYSISSKLKTDYYGDNLYIDPNNQSIFTLFQYTANYDAEYIFYGSMQKSSFLNERVSYYGDVNDLADDNAYTILNDSSYIFPQNHTTGYVELKMMHNSDTSSMCLGIDSSFAFTLPLQMTEYFNYPDLNVDSTNQLSEVPYNIIEAGALPYTIQNLCQQPDYCDTVKVHGDTVICGSGQAVLFTAYKNAACGEIVQWSIDSSAVSSVTTVNDTTVAVVFKDINWQGELYGTLPATSSCTLPVTDPLTLHLSQVRQGIDLGADTTICNITTDTLNAGGGFKTYKWQDGSTDSFYVVRKAGTYYVSVTDYCGDVFSDTIHILSAQYSFSIGRDTSKCNGDSVLLTATAGFIDYQWSPNYNLSKDTGQAVYAYPAITTSYIGIAEKTAGCFVRDTVVITVLTSPAIHLGDDTSLCQNQSLLLNAGGGFADYAWSTGQTTQSISVDAKGVYSVVATAADGCSSKDTIQVLNVAPLPVFILGDDTALCEYQQLVYGFSLPNATYLWSNGNSTGADTISQQGQYWLKVTEGGCAKADTINVAYKPVSLIHLGNDTSLCQNQSLLLNAGNGFADYVWSTGQTTESITVDAKGVYSVVATAADGCSSTDTIQVLNVAPLPVFSLGDDTTLCEYQRLVYGFNLPNATYLWSNGNSTGVDTVSQQGQYWLKVTEGGCTKADTINVSYKPAPVVNLGNDTTLCEGATKSLNAYNDNATYIWQDGSTGSVYLVQEAGLYFVTADIAGCTASDSVNISYIPAPVFSLGRDTFLCGGTTILLNPALNTVADYLWQDGSKQSSYLVKDTGVYYLTAKNECGSFTDSITVANGLCKLVMPSAFTPNGDGLNDVFRVKYPFAVEEFEFVIYNRWGQKVFETNDMSKGWDGTLNGFAQPSGTYVWVISLTDAENVKQKGEGTVVLVR